LIDCGLGMACKVMKQPKHIAGAVGQCFRGRLLVV
jgi:hypothetical protein